MDFYDAVEKHLHFEGFGLILVIEGGPRFGFEPVAE